jgi:hypothetical protein
MEFHVLGRLEAERDGASVSLGSYRQRSVLALHLIHANKVVSTDRIIDDLWGDQAGANRQNAQWVHLDPRWGTRSASAADGVFVPANTAFDPEQCRPSDVPAATATLPVELCAVNRDSAASGQWRFDASDLMPTGIGSPAEDGSSGAASGSKTQPVASGTGGGRNGSNSARRPPPILQRLVDHWCRAAVSFDVLRVEVGRCVRLTPR